MNALETTAGTPLKTFLMRLIWLCMLPLVLLAAWLAYDRVVTGQREQAREATALARNIASTIDQRLRIHVGALNMLALSPLLDDRTRWIDLYNEARGFQQSFGSHVVLADVGEPMQMLFNTRNPFGSKLPPLPKPSGHAAAPTAVATLMPAVGDSFIGPITKELLVAVAVPALRDGKAAFVLLSTFEARLFQKRLERFTIPAGWAVSLLDGRGDVIARRAPPGLDSARDVDPDGRFVVESEVSPWSIVLEIPRELQRAALIKAGFALGLALLAATLAGVLGGQLAGRRLSRAVNSLAEGQPPPLSEIAEIGAARQRLDRTAADLQASEERFRHLFDSAPLPLAYIGDDGRLLAHNARFEKLFGYRGDDVPTIADWWRLACPEPDERQRVRQAWDDAVGHAVEGGTDIEAGEYPLTCKDGSRRIVQLSGIAMPRGLLASFSDVTAQRQAEASLRLWAESFENARLGLAISDVRSNTFVAVNPAFARERGYEREEMVGLPVMSLFPADRMDETRQRIAALDASSHGVFESEHLTRDGQRFPVLLDITVLRGADGRPVSRVAYALDIGERKRAEQALAEAQATALEQQKLARLAALNQMEDANAARCSAELAESEIRRLNASLEQRVEQRTAELTAANRELDSFAYAVSHDLRAPLRAMNGFSRALQEDFGEQLPADAKGYLEQIGVACRKMGELVDGILTLSRSTRSQQQREAIDLSALAAELLAAMARQEPERRVTCTVEPDLTAEGDRRMIEAALENLLANAWKYTAKTEAPEIRIYAEDRDGERWFCVADNGAGFAMAHAERLFKPFQRLHRQEEFPGLGIGLATVQRIVHRHGGDIAARGEPGRGAVFSFTLPAAAATATEE